MKGFNFEKDLPHQKQAVKSTIAVFENLPILQHKRVDKNYINPVLKYQNSQYKTNICNIHTIKQITNSSTFKTQNSIQELNNNFNTKDYEKSSTH